MDQSRLNELPTDGDINVSVRFKNNSQSMNCDRDLAEENEEKVEKSSLASAGLSQSLDPTRLEQSLEYNTMKILQYWLGSLQ